MNILEKAKDSLDFDDEGGIDGYLVSGAAIVSSLLVKRILGYTWKKAMKSDPPKNPADHDVSLKEALAWTLITGIVASLVKLLVRRNVVVGARKAK